MSRAPIRVRTIIRDGRCPEGRVVGETTLRPLGADERRAGMRDDYSAWVARHGDGTSVRHREWRAAAGEDGGVPEPAETHVDLPEELQLEIYREMLPRFRSVARQLVAQGAVPPSDEEHTVEVLFDFCRDAMPGFDPGKSARRTFLWNVLERKRASIVRRVNAKKRQGAMNSVGIVPMLDDDGDCGDGGLSEEDLADPRSIAGMEFNWAWDDLEELCAPDERLALHMLYRGHTASEVASRLHLTLCKFRRTVQGPLQMKCEFVGFCPVHGRFILR